MDGNIFPTELVLQICTTDEIPKHAVAARLHAYHCPIDMFNCGELGLVMGTLTRTELAMVSKHSAFFQGGLFGGSSGGVYALMNGKVLAMHLDSRSVARSVEEVQEQVDTATDDCSVTDSYAAASDSHIGSYSSFAQGMIICKYAKLMKALNEL